MLLFLLACTTAQENGSPAAESPPAEIPPPNVLMLSIDTLRRTALGRYGGGSDSPFLDELAEGSLALDRHQTCSAWTYPGLICTLTGKMLYELGIMPRVDGPIETMPPLPAEARTLATELGAAGYQNFLLTTSRHLGSLHGLDRGYLYSEMLEGGRAEKVVDLGLEWLENGKIDLARPWMLHLHFLDPHAPYDPPMAYRTGLEGRTVLPWNLASEAGLTAFLEEEHSLDEETKREAREQLRILYAGEVHFLDDQLRRLIATIERKGILENLLVVVWNDHGEQFWEHREFGHNQSLFAEENDGLMLLSGPGITATSWEEGTSSLDLLPTLLSILKLPIPEDLRGVVVGQAEPRRPIPGLLWPTDLPPVQSITMDQEKLIYNWDGSIYYYRRGTDPAENRNAYDPELPKVKLAWEQMRLEVETLLPLVPGESPLGMP